MFYAKNWKIDVLSIFIQNQVNFRNLNLKIGPNRKIRKRQGILVSMSVIFWKLRLEK